jgi:WD40 repeat protein
MPRDLVFLSYAHEDARWLQLLLTVLSPVINEGEIKVWWDREIKVGRIWRPEIQAALDSAAVAVLLISPDYLASNFIRRHELPELLDAAEAGLLTPVWVPIRRAHYTGRLAAIQAAADPARPLDYLSRPARDRALFQVSETILSAARDRVAATAMQPTPVPEHPPGPRVPASRVEVEALSQVERERLQDLAVFPPEARIPKSVVVRLWSKTGGLDTDGANELLEGLQRKRFLEIVGSDSTSEVVLARQQYEPPNARAEAPAAAHNELLEAFADGLPTGENGRPQWHTLPTEELYPWVHLHKHLRAAGRAQELRSLLLDHRWLAAKLRTAGLSSLFADFQGFEDEPDITAVVETLRLSTHVLSHAPDQLAAQLTARLLAKDRQPIQAMLERISQLAERVWLRPLTASLAGPGGALIRTLEGHAGGVTAVTATPDGHLAVSGSDDHLVKVWDLEAGEEIYTLVGHEGWVTAIQATRDGRRAISGSNDCTLRVWDLETGRGLHNLVGHDAWIDAVALTTDERQVISRSVDGTVKVWDLEHGQNIFTLLVPVDEFVPLSAWSHGAGLVWNRAPGSPGGARTLAITQNARWAASGAANGTVTKWDLTMKGDEATGSAGEVWASEGHSLAVNAVAITSDGQQVVSGSADGTVKLWDVSRPGAVRTLDDHADQVWALALAEGRRRLVSGAADRTLKVWDLDRSDEVVGSHRHPSAVRSMVFSADGAKAVSASWDGTLMVWDVGKREPTRSLAGDTRPPDLLAVTAEARRAVCGVGDATLVVRDLKTGEAVGVLTGHTRAVRALAPLAGGRGCVSGSADGTLRVWNVEAVEETHILARGLRWISALAAAADAGRVVSGLTDGTVQVWDLETRAEICRLPPHSGSVSMVALTRDGSQAMSRSAEGDVKVWDVETGKEIASFMDPVVGSKSDVLLPDLRWMVSPSGDELIAWDLANRREVTSFRADARIVSCAVAPDGLTLAAGDAGGQVHFLRIERRK